MSSSALCDILHFMDSQGIKRVSVIGLGRMGHGIAQTFAMAGCQVRGFDVDAETRRQTPERIRVNLGVMADVGLFERQGIDTCVARLTVTDSLADAVAGQLGNRAVGPALLLLVASCGQDCWAAAAVGCA